MGERAKEEGDELGEGPVGIAESEVNLEERRERSLSSEANLLVIVDRLTRADLIQKEQTNG